MKSPPRSKLHTAVRIALVLQILVVLFAAFIHIHFSRPCIENERHRVSSPDNKTDAILIDQSCISTHGYYSKFNLYFVHTNESESAVSPALIEEDINIVKAEWLSPVKFNMKYEQNGSKYKLDILLE